MAGRAMWRTVALCAAVAVAAAAEASEGGRRGMQALELRQDCPCGFAGEDCAVKLEVKGEPNGTCVNGECALAYQSSEEVYAVCECSRDWVGALCDESRPVLVWNMIVGGFVLPLVLGAGSGLWLRLKGGPGSFEFDPRKLTSGRDCVSDKVVLAFRIAALLFAVSVQILQFHNVTVNLKWRIGVLFRFFTTLNFVLLIMYFGLGSYLSAQRVRAGPAGNLPREPTFLEKVFFLIVEVELPNTILIAIVVWSVLAPANPTVFNFISYVQHGANVAMMVVDVSLTKMPRFRFMHCLYAVIFGCVYLFGHAAFLAAEYAAGNSHSPSYPFLSMTSPLLSVFIVGLLIAISIIYVATAWCVNRASRSDSDPSWDLDKAEGLAEKEKEDQQMPALTL